MKFLTPKIEIDEQGREVHTLDLKYANTFAFILIPVVLGVCFPPYYLMYGIPDLSIPVSSIFLFFMSVLILGIILHELLHGLVWAFYAKDGFSAIKFGIKWSSLTPYCHCQNSLKVWQYRAGALAPLLVMGIIPLIFSLFLGIGLFFYLGVFFILAAAGDILAVIMLHGFDRNQVVHDHPEEMGYIVEGKNK